MNCVLFVLNREESDACLWKDVQRIHVSGSNDAENKSDVVGNLKRCVAFMSCCKLLHHSVLYHGLYKRFA